MFNVGLIDSLRLRVKKDDIKIIDEALIKPYLRFYPDSMTFRIEDYAAEPLTKVLNGITYRYYFKTYPDKNRVLQEYLVLQISAKMLKEQYFEGITKDNYKRIVKDINDQYIIKISNDVFFNGLVSDIDICINQLIDIKSYHTALSLLHAFPKSSALPLMKLFQNKKNGHFVNLGLNFNARDKATNSKPFIKIYHKGLELQGKSLAFYSAFLYGIEKYTRSTFIDNLVRYEFTIKAYDHKKYLSEKGFFDTELKTFSDLVSMPVQQLTKIAKSGIENYIDKPKKVRVPSELSPIEKLLFKSFVDLIQKANYDRDSLKAYVNDIECPVTKSRMKSKITEILKYIEGENTSISEQLNTNKKMHQFLKNIGY